MNATLHRGAISHALWFASREKEEREFICQVNNNTVIMICYNNYNSRLPEEAYVHQSWPPMIANKIIITDIDRKQYEKQRLAVVIQYWCVTERQTHTNRHKHMTTVNTRA